MPYTPPQTLLVSTSPQPEVTGGSAGAMEAASRGDHQHPRLTSSTRVVLDANGMVTVVYTRSFVAKPAITVTAINPSGRAVMLEIVNDVVTNGLYTGCVLKGYRSQLLPSLSGILLIGPLLTALGNFDVVGGSAAGVEVNVIAIQAST